MVFSLSKYNPFFNYNAIIFSISYKIFKKTSLLRLFDLFFI